MTTTALCISHVFSIMDQSQKAWLGLSCSGQPLLSCPSFLIASVHTSVTHPGHSASCLAMSRMLGYVLCLLVRGTHNIPRFDSGHFCHSVWSGAPHPQLFCHIALFTARCSTVECLADCRPTLVQRTPLMFSHVLTRITPLMLQVSPTCLSVLPLRRASTTRSSLRS